MSATALGLVCLAAVVHAGWNLLVKQVRDDAELVTWLALAAASVLLGLALAAESMVRGPTLIWTWHAVGSVWPYVVGSAAAEAAYVVLLTAAYRHGDLSVVYPVARGTAPLFLAGWTTLFLGQVPRVGGMIGICILAIGVVMVAGTAGPRSIAASVPTTGSGDGLAAQPARAGALHRRWADILLTLGVALCISAYSVVDGAAMRHAPAAAYECTVFGLGALFTAPVVLRRARWATVRSVVGRRWGRVLIVGGGMAGAYVAVLIAFRLAPVAYVGATREVSIVIAALAGWRVLGERFSLARLLGSVVIVLGIASIIRFG